MTCNFHIGQKVVAVKRADIPKPIVEGVARITAGSVLTIRAIQTMMRCVGEVQTGLIFEEIRNEVINTSWGLFEFDYDYRFFRPIAERKTDISVFRAMLNPSKTEVPA